MTTFADFLHQRLETAGFSAEDALACFLPLVRQVAAAHRAGFVAPLQGVNNIRVENARLWYEESLLRKPTLEPHKVKALEQPAARAVEVVGHYRVQTDVDQGADTVVSVQVGKRGEPLTQPVYLPGFVSWEQEVGHHDALSDVFVLGLIFASMTCGLDLNDPAQLNQFVLRRRNLFEFNPHLHPVLAKAITRMTELERRRRPQDSTTLLRTLENYRDQDVDFDFDLARIPSFQNADRPGRRALILSALQQRLFEISRRNRLLHFRATTQMVNLTWASVPLSFDVQNVRPEQIVTWNHAFKNAIAGGAAVSLNKYLRFEEALYLPGQLDGIRNEARRDQNEYGFAQLRLVVCFLRWANLKEKPPERFDSPLVLLPVRLTKTKGVRDVYTLEPTGTEAEINPVLRFYLKQLYGVELPEFIELTENSLDELHAHLAAKVQASEPAVTVEKIDKPRINLIHAKAQRRLDQYRRRQRLSGRGVRSFLDLDYSYDRDNYHPLGLRLFQTHIVTPEHRLRNVIEESPRPRSHMAPTEEAVVTEKERQLYSQAEEETNPYRWEFDLCNVTLGNFHYRKMSLVRDYSVLLDNDEEHAAFDAIFSLQPRPTLAAPPAPLPSAESYPIVNCDPTQASAIALARTGQSFIIQGPPGTGKSQTITNLIADFVAQGKRVLFVCEKRAAIDVVYHRLQQAGLQQLCCLIHDSQEDKKEFIQELKQTYESFLESKQTKAEDKRQRVLEQLANELAPLARFDEAMRAAPEPAGVPLQRLFQRGVELRAQMPDQDARSREQTPTYRFWHESRAGVERIAEQLDGIQSDAVFANHPLGRLHQRIAQEERPLEFIRRTLPTIDSLLTRLQDGLRACALPAECWDTLEKAQRVVEHATTLAFLAEHDLLAVLTAKSELAKKLTAFRKAHTAKRAELERAQTANKNWRQKLSAEETTFALEQARQQQSSLWRFLQPSWWRLRGVMNRSYDFRAHRVAPTWSQVLEKLHNEHKIDAEQAQVETEARAEFAFTDTFSDFSDQVKTLVEALERQPAYLQTFHRHALTSERGNESVRELAALHGSVVQLQQELAGVVVDVQDLSLDQLQEELRRIEAALDVLPSFVPCLKELAALPAPLARAFRQLPLTVDRLEAAMARRTIDELLRADPPLARFTSASHAERVAKLEKNHAQLHDVSAAVVHERVRRRFLEHVRIASLPHAQLTAEQKEFKTLYNRGRRELEHEFGKTMRYRSIRDLVASDSGQVLQDLKPVWLMSPLSVSDTLPFGAPFDVVIFDEASQVTLEEAVPAIFRARQVLVVGDEMQLPPTSFFASKQVDDEERVFVEDEAGQEVEYDLSSNSFLNHAARNLQSTMLGWHYRSRSESLISFSNAAFYQGRLLTVPEVSLPPVDLAEIVVRAAADGADAKRLLQRPVSFHFMEHGVYQQRRNTAEAEYIAQLVRGLLAGGSGASIGIIAFSEAQQGEIEDALQRLAGTDAEFRARLDAELEREQDGQFVGLLVKNLENIQGDERDIILLSVCYGPGPNGKVLMNFGPINQSGGERRLNVAFSRAKKHMALLSSMRQHAITNDYNDGARALKNYLRYAEAQSAADAAGVRRVLWEINPVEGMRREAGASDVVIGEIAAGLRRLGYHVDLDVGQSGFRCDLAVRRPEERAYRLGIFIDTDAYYQNSNLIERDVLRPQLLRNFGWTTMLVLTKDWFEEAEKTLGKIQQRLG